jgi:hypothetical protein
VRRRIVPWLLALPVWAGVWLMAGFLGVLLFVGVCLIALGMVLLVAGEVA